MPNQPIKPNVQRKICSKKFSQSVKKSAGKVVTGVSLALALGACDPAIEPVNRVLGNFNIKEVTPAETSVQIRSRRSD